MEVMIHLIAELIKIAILSSIYSVVILFIFKFFSKKQINGLRNYVKNWLRIGTIISVLLFIFMFTHWGNHGFGDSARIPLKKGLVLDNIDWNEVAFIEEIKTENESPLETTKFIITKDLLLGNLQSTFYDYQNKYFVLDFRNKELLEFENEKKFDIYTNRNNLPNRSTFLSFEDNYHQYWSGWRFWLLP